MEGSLDIRAVLSDYVESGLESGFLFQLQGMMGQGEATRSSDQMACLSLRWVELAVVGSGFRHQDPVIFISTHVKLFS